MSLPPAFSDAEEYFEDCITFLKRYRNLYCQANTEVLRDDLDFHVQLIEHVDSSKRSEGIDLSEFSRIFFQDLARLTPCYEELMLCDEKNGVSSPMSQKKAHEVVHLTEEVKNLCQAVGCKTVVDLGAGLGYIDQQIFLKTGLNVLGLEGKESLYVNAKANQRKYHSDSLSRVKYIRHVVSENSDMNIGTYLKDKFPDDNKGFCFMGLHACGDLTVSAIDLFIKMAESRALIVTPCCYHRMAADAHNVHRFKNFPLSATFKRIYEKYEAYEYLCIPFLRMAAQPSYLKDENLEDRVFCLLARALLNVYARKYNCHVQKKRRKAVRLPSLNNDFAKYAAEAATKGFQLVSEDKEVINTVEFNLTELQSMWENIPKTTFTYAALYISFQNHMPPVFENLILYDRLVYLKEQGVYGCHFKKVVNEKISPKCLSLVAYKENIESGS